MSEYIVTLEQLKTLFISLTAKILPSYSPNYIRRDYPDEGQPAQTNKENVIYIWVYEVNDPWNKLVDVDLSPGGDNKSNIIGYNSSRVIGTHWTFYGPASFDDAHNFKIRMLSPSNLALLSINQVYLVPQIQTITPGPYYLEGQQWQRYDLVTKWNVSDRREEVVPTIDPAQPITLNIET